MYCFSCAREVSRTSAAKDRSKARERGAKWYAENKERKNEKTRAWDAANPEKRAAISAAFRARNPEKARESWLKYYRENREKCLAKDKRAREANLEKFLERERASYVLHAEKRKAKSKRWREANPEAVTMQAAVRRSAIAKRTPSWLTHEDYARMRTFFWLALLLRHATGVMHHVDHIIPLRGKTVSGLNVPWNMQVLPAVENLKKSNRHDV